MNQPQPGSLESTAPPPDAATMRMRELERTLAYDFCCSVIETELVCVTEGLVLDEQWFDEGSTQRTDELIPECIEYLTARGLIARAPGHPGWINILDESEEGD